MRNFRDRMVGSVGLDLLGGAGDERLAVGGEAASGALTGNFDIWHWYR